ncbi:hypothetical protein ACFORJ_01605 [Corynebacterium hansenii]|uniref:Uncharacterized protein n=1 Tax=Corynebacterium hansenii TaxID=394964 RepID=A0ABV7ZJX5_9CORY|nr:hypothetical protein [Corynebacterium hansenii]WJY99305.1 hypothetical protein CHAN_03385 [Corynebacterium hansenii]
MTPDEREACQWMQADVRTFARRMVIIEIHASSVELIEKDGARWNVPPERVTPRPDLPRLEWPDSEPVSDTRPSINDALPHGFRLADHPVHGRVVVTATEPDRDGELYFVCPFPGTGRNRGGGWCKPDVLTFVGTTPAPNRLAVGSTWDDGDALDEAVRTSGRDDVIAMNAANRPHRYCAATGRWHGEHWGPDGPHDMAPWTVLHTGWEADQ